MSGYTGCGLHTPSYHCICKASTVALALLYNFKFGFFTNYCILFPYNLVFMHTISHGIGHGIVTMKLATSLFNIFAVYTCYFIYTYILIKISSLVSMKTLNIHH